MKKTAKPTPRDPARVAATSNVGNNVAGNSAAIPGESVDQIRNIIFGAQMEAYENRFSSLEERMLNELALQREESSRRFDAVREELATERKQRTEEAGRDRLAQEHQLDQEVQALNTDIQKRHDELLKLLNKHVDRVANDKANRRDLARLLTKMAEQLSDDSKAAAANTKARK